MRIKKTQQTVGVVGTVANEYTEDENAVYNAPYLNGDVLYNNTSGTSSNINLGDVDTNNYKYIEIFYSDINNIYNSVKVYQPNGKTVSLMTSLYSSGFVRIDVARIKINGNTITFNATNGYAIISTTPNATQAQSIKIYRIVGYK